MPPKTNKRRQFETGDLVYDTYYEGVFVIMGISDVSEGQTPGLDMHMMYVGPASVLSVHGQTPRSEHKIYVQQRFSKELKLLVPAHA